MRIYTSYKSPVLGQFYTIPIYLAYRDLSVLQVYGTKMEGDKLQIQDTLLNVTLRFLYRKGVIT